MPSVAFIVDREGVAVVEACVCGQACAGSFIEHWIELVATLVHTWIIMRVGKFTVKTRLCTMVLLY